MDQLSIRLQMVYDSVDKKRASIGRVIDVGSDHGLLALECLKTDLTPYCICTDIHKQPAERTRMCLADNGMANKSEVYCTDGLKGISLKSNDTVIMAGLGGNTTIDVITEAISVTDKSVLENVDFVLQPQKSVDRLREFLSQNGFVIFDETVSIDRGLYYVCLRTRFTGKVTSLTLKEKYYGPCLLTKKDDLVDEYYAHLTNIYLLRSRGDEEIKKLLEE